MKERSPKEQFSIPTKEIISMISSVNSMEDVELLIRYISKTPSEGGNPLESKEQHIFTPEESRAISEAVNNRIREVDEGVRKELLNFLTRLKPPDIRSNVTESND
jgi:hypothetical protein